MCIVFNPYVHVIREWVEVGFHVALVFCYSGTHVFIASVLDTHISRIFIRLLFFFRILIF
jgi:hypothetical protein